MAFCNMSIIVGSKCKLHCILVTCTFYSTLNYLYYSALSQLQQCAAPSASAPLWKMKTSFQKNKVKKNHTALNLPNNTKINKLNPINERHQNSTAKTFLTLVAQPANILYRRLEKLIRDRLLISPHPCFRGYRSLLTATLAAWSR